MSEIGADRDKGFFGHPKGLRTLFFTEMWERFSFYGMRALLKPFLYTSIAAGGMGMASEDATSIYHIYLALVYVVSLPGGWIADRFLGQRRAVLVGAIVIMLGHIALAVHGLSWFLSGLALVVIGTGFLKPNISTIVGQLYSREDARRDAGFSIFYMGINLGAFIAPLVTGFLAQKPWFQQQLAEWGIPARYCWQFGFGAAAVGMFIGILQYIAGGKNMGSAGLEPVPATDPAQRARDLKVLWGGLIGFAALIGGGALLHVSGTYVLSIQRIDEAFGWILTGIAVAFFAWMFTAGRYSPDERRRLYVIFLLFLASCVFWSAFEQAGSTLNDFALLRTRNEILGVEFPSTWFQSVNSVLIILCAPLMAWLWIRLGRRDPSSPIKFSLGLFFAGLGFLILAFGAGLLVEGNDAVKVGPLWLALTYLCHSIGELCLSPVGLSTFSRLAPERIAGLMLGVFFLSISVGSYWGGRIANYYDRADLPNQQLFFAIAGYAIGAALLLALFASPIQRMLRPASPGGSGH
ncbi:MAG: MFS transporter [Planctomycetes bacterium]|nr:MFS transporter [Planctomycetota bacterium]